MRLKTVSLSVIFALGYLIVALALYAYLGEAKAVMHTSEVKYLIQHQDVLVARLEKHLSAHPEDQQGWYYLGRLYMSKGKMKPAMQAFKRAGFKLQKPKHT